MNEGTLQVEADTFRLALFNLLDNALRFANENTTITVHVDVACLTVTNTGPVIPDYALGRITERF